tara:strand:+ start:7467 stop:8183 length:717 start_codon:yes stop_codon:yes gene_type:complete
MNILVTGGSSGLGKSIVEKLCSDRNNHIYFTYNNSVERSKDICSKYANSTSIKCDFTSDSELNIFLSNFRKLDISLLINNYYSWPKNPLLPGTFLDRNFHKIDETIFVEEFKNNVIPTILITQEAIKHFRSKKSGKIITILSSFLDSPTIGSSIYISNKNYLKGLAKVWELENVKYNITSNTISPSFMLTPHTLKMDERLIDGFRNDFSELMTVRHVSDRIFDFLRKSGNGYEHDISI